MSLEGSSRALKYLVVFFNFLFFAIGIILIGVGSWAEVRYGDFVDITSLNYVTASRIIIAVGVIVAVVSFLGCCGAWKESKNVLYVFFAILLILLILEIAGAVLGYVYSDKVKEQLNKDLNNALLNDYGSQEGTTKAIDALQEKEKCCGVANYTNWFRSKYSEGNHTKLPDSCCKTKKPNCANPMKSVEDVYPKGCYEKLMESIYDKLYLIGSVCIAIIIAQILGMIFAAVLIRGITRDKANFA
ncbi:tetraspanin-9-like [Actinia tenebrosa]|uniref:Tetraspanin n=1 Tax=Actinia tenebrosa TaxID=6105 RepID=A0A6P8J203_ACTTE|nr:tetraspanin-9-like [Actinia tenebrosa]XP_031573560.1 tetraspanin-9-like [Actinia tenebrosa]